MSGARWLCDRVSSKRWVCVICVLARYVCVIRVSARGVCDLCVSALCVCQRAVCVICVSVHCVFAALKRVRGGLLESHCGTAVLLAFCPILAAFNHTTCKSHCFASLIFVFQNSFLTFSKTHDSVRLLENPPMLSPISTRHGAETPCYAALAQCCTNSCTGLAHPDTS